MGRGLLDANLHIFFDFGDVFGQKVSTAGLLSAVSGCLMTAPGRLLTIISKAGTAPLLAPTPSPPRETTTLTTNMDLDVGRLHFYGVLLGKTG